MHPITLTLLVLATACRPDHRPVPQPPAPLGTQADLAREIDDADRRGTWTEVRTRWQGQRVRWTVTRQKSLCTTPERCNVAAFPIQRPAQHGWMPKLALTPEMFAKLEARCGAAEQCDVTVEGTLAELVVSAEHPTSMKLTDVRI
jgi:hypothetical protein